jgi:hypothetical protein
MCMIIVALPFIDDDNDNDMGIFQWLGGSNAGSASPSSLSLSRWASPVARGLLGITSSHSIHYRDLASIIDPSMYTSTNPHHRQLSVMLPSQLAWHITFDFKDHRVRATHYTLTCANDQPAQSLANWILQGSHDGNEWYDIDRRDHDGALSVQQYKSQSPVAGRHGDGIVYVVGHDTKTPPLTAINASTNNMAIDKVTFPVSVLSAPTTSFYRYYRLTAGQATSSSSSSSSDVTWGSTTPMNRKLAKNHHAQPQHMKPYTLMNIELYGFVLPPGSMSPSLSPFPTSSAS